MKLIALAALALIAGCRASAPSSAAPETSRAVRELGDVRLTDSEVTTRCGKPARQWRETHHQGLLVQEEIHLWYPEKRAEVILASFPNSIKETEHSWSLLAGSPSPKSDDMYTAKELANRMPCLGAPAQEWARYKAQ